MLLQTDKLKASQTNNFFLLAGPCVIEGEDMALNIAEHIVKITRRLDIPYIFKGSYRKANRSRIDSFTGIGDEKALRILRRISETFGIPVVTDIHTAAEAAIKDWTKAKADASKASAKAKPVNLFTTLPLLMVAFALFFGIGIFVMGQNLPKFLIGFVGLFVVVVIAMILGKQSTMAYYGIGVEPWGIMFGMIIARSAPRSG